MLNMMPSFKRRSQCVTFWQRIEENEHAAKEIQTEAAPPGVEEMTCLFAMKN
jgi:hypothetical protein